MDDKEVMGQQALSHPVPGRKSETAWTDTSRVPFIFFCFGDSFTLSIPLPFLLVKIADADVNAPCYIVLSYTKYDTFKSEIPLNP